MGLASLVREFFIMWFEKHDFKSMIDMNNRIVGEKVEIVLKKQVTVNDNRKKGNLKGILVNVCPLTFDITLITSELNISNFTILLSHSIDQVKVIGSKKYLDIL